MLDVGLCACENYTYEKCRAAIESAVDAVGGFGFVFPGCKVVIKANLVSALKPEKAAVTHPMLLCALSDILREKGASVTIGDSPGGVYSSPFVTRVYNVTRVIEAENHGAKLNRDFGTSQADYPKAVAAKRFYYTSYLDNADFIIDFCKLKTHGMMGMSAAVKNMFGVVPGTVKPEYHYKYPDPVVFTHMLIDLNEYFHPVLSLCDAVECMEGNGPTAGVPRFMGVVAASTSQYKLDVVCARLIGIDPLSVKTVSISKERGLLPEDLSKITVSGDIDQYIIKDFDTDSVLHNKLFVSENMNFGGGIIGKTIKKLISSKPSPLKRECIGCGECARICPAKAIRMVRKKPSIDRKKCIKCFCCQEFCPVGAMKVKRTPVARILQK